MKVSQDRFVLAKKLISDLVPYEKNSRTHTDEQIDQVIKSIKEFGWTSPIVIDDKNTILAGHARTMAATKMGLVEVPCMILKGLSEEKKKAFIIADNKLALNAGWDDEILREEMIFLKDLNYDLNILGFDGDEMKVIMEGWDSNIEIDDVGGKKGNPDYGVLKFTVAKQDMDRAGKILEAALKKNNIEYEI